jgi:hypothetical protein
MLIFAFSSTQMSDDRAAAQAQINAVMNSAGRKAGGVFGTIGDIIKAVSAKSLPSPGGLRSPVVASVQCVKVG